MSLKKKMRKYPPSFLFFAHEVKIDVDNEGNEQAIFRDTYNRLDAEDVSHEIR